MPIEEGSGARSVHPTGQEAPPSSDSSYERPPETLQPPPEREGAALMAGFSLAARVEAVPGVRAAARGSAARRPRSPARPYTSSSAVWLRNRVNSAAKFIGTVPTAPERCLAMLISASPGWSEPGL